MNKITRLLFLAVGCIFPIFIGVLHTIIHFSQLIRPQISEFLSQEFVILGKSQPLWHTWGIVSFMMGAAFIIIGLLNTAAFLKLDKKAVPPKSALLIMIIYQLCVTYVGYTFEQAFQFYGGIGGILLLLVALVFILRASKVTQ